jgi:DNA-nicking Smr family endonuclease
VTLLDPLEGTPADTLDLHGCRASEAAAAVRAFVQRARRRTPGALVHVITGRGRNSPNGPVLKPTVKRLLESGSLPVKTWGEDLDEGGFLLRLR